MSLGTSMFFIVLWFWGFSHCGLQTKPHSSKTDQELFWGADQYDFSVVLPAADTECFWHFAHHGEKFYLSFMVQWVTGVSLVRDLSVTVNAPSGLLISSADDAKGQINFDVKETGFYQMCLSNFLNRFTTMQVLLSFGVYYDNQNNQNSAKDTERDKQEEELNNTLNFIQAATSKVERHVFHMFRYYSFGRMRRSADHFLLQSNSRYITWWSMALSLLIITSGYLQLLFLKSLFVSKAEAEKPRC